MKLVGWSIGLLLSLPAAADIYKSVDKDGHITYSSVPSVGAKRLNLQTPRPKQLSTSHTTSPSDFPKVDGKTQRGRDDTRRRILEQERATELALLNEARTKPGSQADIGLHEKNIEALNSELARVK